MRPSRKRAKREFNGRGFSISYIMAYHVIEGFGKDLGMDPLFLTPKSDQIFHMTNSLRETLKRLGRKAFNFVRHHFRDDTVGRDSFFSKDILITDNENHPVWESLSEAETLVVLNGYKQLVRMKGSGSRMKGTSGINEITTIDIESVFKGNEWVYTRWYSNPKFTSNLNKFNERRLDIRSLRLNNFIQKYYPIAYARFYENILKNKRPQLQSFLSELHPALDLSYLKAAASNDAYIKAITRALSELLRQEHYPIKI